MLRLTLGALVQQTQPAYARALRGARDTLAARLLLKLTQHLPGSTLCVAAARRWWGLPALPCPVLQMGVGTAEQHGWV